MKIKLTSIYVDDQEKALRFYTEFANPAKTSYSWNRSLPSAQDAFVAGDVAMYLGFASEYTQIAQRNPNLRFGVAPLPQISQSGTRVTYGRLMGVAIARTTGNITGALAVAQQLSGTAAVGLISGALSLPPVRRDVAVDGAHRDGVAPGFVEVVDVVDGHRDQQQHDRDGDAAPDPLRSLRPLLLLGTSAPLGRGFLALALLAELATRQRHRGLDRCRDRRRLRRSRRRR